jgi:hypothetical protein
MRGTASIDGSARQSLDSMRDQSRRSTFTGSRRLARGGAAAALVALIVAALADTASAQFGHPLKGQWSGDWGPDAGHRTHVLVDIGWDGSALHVVVNPGQNGATLTKNTVDYNTWGVKFEGDGKDASGATVHYVIDGKLENLGSFQRFITGTWTQGNAKGEFKLTRN